MREISSAPWKQRSPLYTRPRSRKPRQRPPPSDTLFYVKALIVDDDLTRHRYFGRWLESHGYDVMHARGYFSAIEALSRRRYDVVMLDHDLCIKQYTDGCSGGWMNGEDVTQFLTQLPSRLRPGFVIVHSWNGGGARRMISRLEARGIPTRYMMSPV